MEQKKETRFSLFKMLSIISIVIVIITGLMTIYYQVFNKDIIELKIGTMDKTQLTNAPDVDGLTVEYMYRDSVVKNLWRIKFFVQNAGSKTIVAKGNDIIKENLSLPIRFVDSIKILSVNSTTNSAINIKDTKDDIINLDFKQWRPLKYIYIEAIVEHFGETSPSVYIDENDILDSKIIFSEYKLPEINKNRKLIQYFENSIIFNILKWETVILIIVWGIVITAKDIRNIRSERNSNKISKSKAIIEVAISALSGIAVILLPLLWIF